MCVSIVKRMTMVHQMKMYYVPSVVRCSVMRSIANYKPNKKGVKNMEIKDLKLNTQAKLTPMVKAKLVEVLQTEFNAQRTKRNYEIEDRKNEILDKYRKQVKFSSLVAKINKAENVVNQAKKVLKATGLCQDGCVNNQSIYNYDTGKHDINQSAKDLQERLNRVENATQPAESLKAKLIARLWVCDTVGEATVIMQNVLGNGVLPTVTVAQLEYKS